MDKSDHEFTTNWSQGDDGNELLNIRINGEKNAKTWVLNFWWQIWNSYIKNGILNDPQGRKFGGKSSQIWRHSCVVLNDLLTFVTNFLFLLTWNMTLSWNTTVH